MAPPSQPAPLRYLTAEDVMARYQLRTPKSARDLMRRAGAIEVGRRLLINPGVLEQYERDELRAAPLPGKATPEPRRHRRPKRHPVDLTALQDDWWQT